MSWLLEQAKGRIRQNLHRDRSLEGRVLALSRRLWPWQERWLLPLAVLLALLDLLSTYVLLELSGKPLIYEDGLLAGWALRTGGFSRLLLVDLTAVMTLYGGALMARSLYSRFGFKGYGRAAFILMLLPYSVAALFATAHNLVLAFFS